MKSLLFFLFSVVCLSNPAFSSTVNGSSLVVNCSYEVLGESYTAAPGDRYCSLKEIPGWIRNSFVVGSCYCPVDGGPARCHESSYGLKAKAEEIFDQCLYPTPALPNDSPWWEIFRN